MQTPKTRAATLEVPQRTPKTARQLKTSGTEADNSSSQSPMSKTPKGRSPKVDRRSPRTPTSEKQRPGKVSELETQLANLQAELKKAKDQLSQSESSKKQAHEEAEEAKKQLVEISEKLQESQCQLDEISASEESRIQELRKISQDRDRAWESELEAVKKHHSMDSAALTAAMNEVQKLKNQLEKVAESEANQAKYAEAAHGEMMKSKLELSDTLAKVEELRLQLKDSQDAEAKALETASQTREQLETLKSTEETLTLEKVKALEAYESLTMELEKSKSQVDLLEDNKTEVEKLRAELEGAERRYQEEYIQSTLQIRGAYELVEQTRTESCQKVSILEANLENLRAELEDLKVKLVEKEEKLQKISEENKNLNEKLREKETEQKGTESYEKVSILEANLENSKAELEDLKAKLVEKEEKLQNISEENNNLKEKLETIEITAVKDTEQIGTESCEKVSILEASLENSKAEMEELKAKLVEKEEKLQKISEENKNLNEKLTVKETEQTGTESYEKVSILEANLESSKAELEDLKVKLAEKEEKLHNISEENKHLNEKLEKTELIIKKDTDDVTDFKKLEADLENMKRVVFEKETELKYMTEENERLKMEKCQVDNEAVASAEAARISEKEAVMKVNYLTEEADKSSKKVVRVTEQLDLAQAANAEIETELRRLKVQSDQWRKAAEAATFMLSGANNNGKYMERTGSLDSHTIGGRLNSPLSEDMEDESPKKKNGNMLKKIGVLLKKSQK
ncbi:interactor of constitutive active ROPs 2, chloroplastic-like [Bidens hawaiensis]|uniref:interactor of constitutive active ROPs 2, chloroplastic-like n=1 Tax=Bidens hawaiensis TaxID=980011 RepID=UPI00404AEDC0